MFLGAGWLWENYGAPACFLGRAAPSAIALTGFPALRCSKVTASSLRTIRIDHLAPGAEGTDNRNRHQDMGDPGGDHQAQAHLALRGKMPGRRHDDFTGEGEKGGFQKHHHHNPGHNMMKQGLPFHGRLNAITACSFMEF
jgi:hypothetical protein